MSKFSTAFRYFSNDCRLNKFKETKWILPEGTPIGLSVYSCVAGEKVPVILNSAQIATWYSCGPTVYDSPHIGHASCYVKLDIIQRILRNFLGVKLISAMGITDIDDKIIKTANESGKDFRAVAKQYEHEFWVDMSKLGVDRPPILTRVSEHIPCIIQFVEKLIESGTAYTTADNSVYFDTVKYGEYGKLQKMQDDSDTTTIGKKNEMDFALWKGHKPGEPFWETKWGRGRPGWHIECSAMVSKIFGAQVDFHAGGIDLQFPHHENEESQSCAYHATKQWTNYWLHVGHLHMRNDIKMSKSLKNTVSINELLEKYSADSFRMACLLSNYRNPMEYSAEMMQNAKSVLNKFKYFLQHCELYINDTTRGDGLYDSDLVKKLQNVEKIVNNQLRDDFDTSSGINTMLNLMNKTTKTMRESKDFYPIPILLISVYIGNVLSRLGLGLRDEALDLEKIVPNEVTDILVELRRAVRQNALTKKDNDLLTACDVARDKLKSLNIQINDIGNTSTWIKAK